MSFIKNLIFTQPQDNPLKKVEPKKTESKVESKVESKKVEPKIETKKAEVKVETKKVETKVEAKKVEIEYDIKELATIVKSIKKDALTLCLFNNDKSYTTTSVNFLINEEYYFMKNKFLNLHLLQLFKKQYKIDTEKITKFKII